MRRRFITLLVRNSTMARSEVRGKQLFQRRVQSGFLRHRDGERSAYAGVGLGVDRGDRIWKRTRHAGAARGEAREHCAGKKQPKPVARSTPQSPTRNKESRQRPGKNG